MLVVSALIKVWIVSLPYMDTHPNCPQEFADALREFSPKHPGIEQAEAASRELQDVRYRLNQERKAFDEQLAKERKGCDDGCSSL